MPPSAKNTEYGIGASSNSALLWSWSFHSTLNVPVGVSLPWPPWLIATGPRVTSPSWINHAWFFARSTQAVP